MRKYFWVAAVALFFLSSVSTISVASPWGANYFPNVTLTTQDGKPQRFFDDLIKDKIVVINFIYTSCVDTCPLETAQLTKVQRILGDRVGQDIFFYSITIDPDHDTPEVLKAYADQFKARWTFLTGDADDIILLRKKLGLYIDEIQDGSNNHNVTMIIGNQSTGRWMKRSPFENPYVLADQVGSWLDGWRRPPRGDDYANAPELRTISSGEQTFRTRCAICHSIDGKQDPNLVGPDLLGVTDRRDEKWLIEWLRAPDRMLAANDPTALALLRQYNNVAMPNLRLSQVDVEELLGFMTDATRDHRTARQGREVSRPGDAIAVSDAWIRAWRDGAGATAGYMTLANGSADDLTLVGFESPAFESVEVHEMVRVAALPRMRKVAALTLPANGRARLAPGGKHMMLMGPRRAFKEGDRVELTFLFDSGVHQTISVAVTRLDDG